MQLRNNKIVMYPGTGLVLVFDVETTGLLPKKNKDPKIDEISFQNIHILHNSVM